MVQFEHPYILWAALGAIAPIIIHLFGNRSRKQELIPSLMWLDEVKSASRRRRKIKDYVVLLFRILTVLFVVAALANPITSVELQKVQVDNYPANWSQKDQWLPSLIAGTNAQTLEIYTRDGTFYGQVSQLGALDLIESMPASSLPFYPIECATLLTFGFSEPQNWPVAVHLPTRNLEQNAQLTVGFNQVEDVILNASKEGLWRSYSKGALVSERRATNISISPNQMSTDTLEISYFGDSISEDNVIQLFKNESINRLIWTYKDLPSGIEAFTTSADSILRYNSAESPALNEFDVVVVVGFPFEPTALSEFKGTVMFFPTEGNAKPPVSSQPVLTHPFFGQYFIGASIQNRWPELNRWIDAVEGGNPLLSSEHGVAATLSRTETGSIYRQFFVTQDWSHPYFKALSRWSGNNELIHIEAPKPLGQDQYQGWITMNEDRVVMHELTTEEQVNTLSFWTPQKFALLLALFCALIALIFAKI